MTTWQPIIRPRSFKKRNGSRKGVRRQRTEDRGQKSEVRSQKTEVRGLRAEVRGLRLRTEGDDRGQKTED